MKRRGRDLREHGVCHCEPGRGSGRGVPVARLDILAIPMLSLYLCVKSGDGDCVHLKIEDEVGD